MTNLKTINFPENEIDFLESFGNEFETDNNTNVILIKNAPNFEKSVELLAKTWFKTTVLKYQNLLGLIFKINDEINQHIDIGTIFVSHEFKGSFFLSFQSVFGERKSKFCWKVHGSDKFYSLFIDDDSTESIADFFYEFLVVELQNNKTG